MLELWAMVALLLGGVPPEDGRPETPGSPEPDLVPVLVPVLVIEDGATLVPDAPEEAGPLSARLFGRFDERLTTDLSWLPEEPVFEARTTLALGMLYEPSAAWSFTVQGRLRHRLVARESAGGAATGDGADGLGAGGGASGGAWTGVLEPELRKLLIQHRPECGPELELGLGVVRWGRTTLARPLDLVSPVDWREGPWVPIEERRLPVVSASARFGLGHSGGGALEVLYVPFFFGMSGPLVGGHGDHASDLPEPLATGLEDDGIRSFDDLTERFGPRQDFIDSGELGLRLTQRLGDLDLGLSWLWRRDRVPGPSGFGRQHVVGLDLGLRLGALGVVGEVAFLSERRMVRADATSEGHFGLDWALELRLQPAIFLDLVAGVSGRHAGGASGVFLELAPDLLSFDYALTLLLAFDGRLKLHAEGHVELSRFGHATRLGLHARVSDAVELGLGLALSDGEKDRFGLPALFRETSHGWLELVFVF